MDPRIIVLYQAYYFSLFMIILSKLDSLTDVEIYGALKSYLFL